MTGTARPTPSPAGLRVGDYRLLTKIGEGGMGVVHLAQAPDGARVALKVLRPHIIGDDEARERLAREVASLRRVKSPRIAAIIDADPWGETPYVATRYVPGLSLHEHIRQEGPITGEDLRWFAAGLAEAVIAVHTVGVLHRDIKPSNVLLEGRSPVLIDFGLARLAEDPRLTHTGWLLGTPGYLAPEILYGDDATTASDVHSWAATVVFAATGHPPFGRGPAMAIMDRVRRGEHDLSAVPAALLPMIRQCLSPDPAERPETTTVLSSLRGPATAAPVSDEFTMPLSLFSSEDQDQDPTDVLGSDGATEVFDDAATRIAPTRIAPASAPAPAPTPTTPLTVHAPQQPARAPYMQPAPPQQTPPPVVPTQPPPEPWRPLPSGLAKFQRGCLLAGLFAGVSVGFAVAPYLSLMLIALAALAIRTFSWTTESVRDRQWRRGRTRWYDGPLAVVTSPWYLVVATGGTLMLLLWSAALAFLVGLAYLLFGLPMVPGLVSMGAVLAFSLWWGPGSRRLRVPTRKIVVRATRWTWLGWVSVGVLTVVLALLLYALVSSGVSWDPQPGPPWRSGTILGDVVAFF
ncbi:MAG TPA: serine/threonine-protein kinase [Nocardioidaceae bacterium]|nr:serine/threonine-protein kinase [Nocardioidaceae bacterium]